jgi:LAS superfamily LD-carboxypeptidase LdcB
MNLKKEKLKIFISSVIILSIPAYVFFVMNYSETKETQESISYVSFAQQQILETENNVTLGNNTQLATNDYFVFANQDPVEFPETERTAICGEYPCYTDDEFLLLYNLFEKRQELQMLNKYIYQNTVADNYIKDFAEKRGYTQRPFADEKDIIPFEGVFTRSEVKKAYTTMRDEMLNESIRLHFVSGFRNSTQQRIIFKDKMGDFDINEISKGMYNTQLDGVLQTSALPGYSKHHSGYAVDFGCGNDYLVYKFAETPCFSWLSENNFQNAKRFGFVPSYPEEALVQGPNPEPWEFVWVGEETIKQKTI